MRPHPLAIATMIITCGVLLSAADASKPGSDWPQFRGISALGTAEGFRTPAEWNIAANKNVRWKARLPGLGLSSPVIWGNLLCVTTAISGQKDAGIKAGLYGNVEPVNDDTSHEWRVACLDKGTDRPRAVFTRM